MDRISIAKSRYLNRKGYQAAFGKFVFAQNEKLGKAVAFVDGVFNRSTFRDVIQEARASGLNRLTVLVNGLITYAGNSLTAIRVDASTDAIYIAHEIDADFMSDVRFSKQSARIAD